MTMTREEAVALGETGWWKDCDPVTICWFQLFEETLCMDFLDYQRAVEASLLRPVYTHEFGSGGIEALRVEFLSTHWRAA